MLTEYYLRLVVPQFPIVLVPEFIFFFAAFNLKGRSDAGLVLVAVFAYDFWGNSMPGAGIIVFLSLLAVLYALSNFIDFRGNVLISAFTALVGSVSYVSAVHLLDGMFARNLLHELTGISRFSWDMVGFIFLEVAVVLVAFIVLRAVYIQRKITRGRRLRVT